jgi:hypothetical protein
MLIYSAVFLRMLTKVLHAEPKGLPVTILYIRTIGCRSETIFVSLLYTVNAHKVRHTA